MVTDCYFSNTHNISKIISEQIFKAKKCILLAMYTLTDRGLINALKDKRKNDIDVLAIFDEDQLAKFSDIILELNNADIVFKTIGKEVARMHHKFLIIDDIKVITGSFNWTRQANKSNMENIMIVEDQNIAKEYISEFDRIWQLIASRGIGKYLKDDADILIEDTKKEDDADIIIEDTEKMRKKASAEDWYRKGLSSIRSGDSFNGYKYLQRAKVLGHEKAQEKIIGWRRNQI